MTRSKQNYMHRMRLINFLLEFKLILLGYVSFICLILFSDICFTINFQFFINRLMERKSLELKCLVKLDKAI